MILSAVTSNGLFVTVTLYNNMANQWRQDICAHNSHRIAIGPQSSKPRLSESSATQTAWSETHNYN